MYGLRVGRNAGAQQFSGAWDDRRAGNGYQYRIGDMGSVADRVVYWYGRGNLAKARRDEARFFRIHAKLQKRGLQLFEAAGAAGRELLPALRRALYPKT